MFSYLYYQEVIYMMNYLSLLKIIGINNPAVIKIMGCLSFFRVIRKLMEHFWKIDSQLLIMVSYNKDLLIKYLNSTVRKNE